MSLQRVVSFDIDGVINNYPDCWLEYLNQRISSKFLSINEAKKNIDLEIYKSIKDDYRFMGENSHFTISNKEMIKIINQFYYAGFFVIISTSRPLLSSQYPNLFNLTSKWLVEEGVKFSELIYKDEFLTYHKHLIERILFHVDDEIKYVNLFKSFNITSYLYSSVSTNEYQISIEHLIEIKNKYASIF